MDVQQCDHDGGDRFCESTASVSSAHLAHPPQLQIHRICELPAEVILRIQVLAGDPVSICGIETTCSAAPRTDDASWLDMLNEILPSLSARLVSEEFGGSYKQVFARRARRAEDWKLRKEVQTRCRLGSAASSVGY